MQHSIKPLLIYHGVACGFPANELDYSCNKVVSGTRKRKCIQDDSGLFHYGASRIPTWADSDTSQLNRIQISIRFPPLLRPFQSGPVESTLSPGGTTFFMIHAGVRDQQQLRLRHAHVRGNTTRWLDRDLEVERSFKQLIDLFYHNLPW